MFILLHNFTIMLEQKKDEYGNIDGWTAENPSDTANSQKNSEQLAKRLIKNLKVSEDCGFKSNCMLAVDYKNADGSAWSTYTKYRDKFYYKVILADGSHVIIKAQGKNCTYRHGGYSNTCGYFILDVNGSNPPNQINKDACVYEITTESLYPAKL